MKQTAVEWVGSEINKISTEFPDQLFYDVALLLQQAKEMEEEQMINYHNHLIEKFTKLEYTFNTDAKLILENFKNTKQ